MGFNRRKMEDQRRQAAEKEAASRKETRFGTKITLHCRLGDGPLRWRRKEQ
jgi:hypothetical protein